MKKVLSILSLLLFVCIGLNAQMKVIVNNTNGSVDMYPFNESTKITFNNGDVSFNSASSSKVYSPRDIEQMSFGDMVSSITLNETARTIGVGEYLTLIATVMPESAGRKDVAWSSSNDDVAMVSSNGVILGISEGTATITATSKDGTGVSASAIITVINPILINSFSFDNTTLIIAPNTPTAIIAKISPEDATNKTLEWTSSNENVATVADGIVTGIYGGVATITAKTTDGSNLSATCTVVVDAPLYDYNNYLESSYTGQYSKSQVGSYITKSIGFYIENKGGESIYINKVIVKKKSNNSSVSTSTDTSLLGQLNAGERKELSFTVNEDISLSSYYYEWYYTYNGHDCIKVSTDPITTIDVYEVKLDAESATMKVGETKSLSAIVLPSIATDKTLTWTSSKTSVATVNANGVVTAIGLGETDITATANNGLSAVCHITVEATPVESISIKADKTEIEIGESLTLKVHILPLTATVKDVNWSSSNEDVAMVSSKGVVLGIGEGTATITAEATDGSEVKATIEITVVQVKVKSITLNHDVYSLDKGESIILEAIVLPENAGNREVSWTSSNEEVALVSQSGKVVYIGDGDAVITATAKDGSGVSASCVFTCLDGIVSITLDDDNIRIYDTNGTILPNTKRGINIIKMNDGKIRKVIVK